MEAPDSRVAFRGRRLRGKARHARCCALGLLIVLATPAPGQAPQEITAPQTRLAIYSSFFMRLALLEDAAAGLGDPNKSGSESRALAARAFGLTEPELALAIGIAAGFRAKAGAVGEQAGRSLTAGDTGNLSPALEERKALLSKAISDLIDQLQAALGQARFAALDKLVVQPRTPEAALRAREAAYRSFFSHVRGIYATAYPGEAHPLTRTEAEREFGLTAAELARAKPIAADWHAKHSAVEEAMRKLSAGKRSDPLKLQDLTARSRNVTLDHIDRLAAAFGPARFAAMDAAIIEGYRSGAFARDTQLITVVESNGKSTVLQNAGMTYSGGSPGATAKAPGVVFETPAGVRTFYGWAVMTELKLSKGKLKITLSGRQPTVSGSIPSGSSVVGETLDGRAVNIPLQNIKRITVPHETRRPAPGNFPTSPLAAGRA